MHMEINNLLKKNGLLPLLITQLLSILNSTLFKNALVAYMTYCLAVTAEFSSPIAMTLVASFFILPIFLFSAIAGQLGDKYEKPRFIAFLKLAEILLMFVATAGFYAQSITLLLLVLFGLGIQTTFLEPVRYAILPEQL